MISLWARRTVRLTVGVCGHDGNTRTPRAKGRRGAVYSITGEDEDEHLAAVNSSKFHIFFSPLTEIRF